MRESVAEPQSQKVHPYGQPRLVSMMAAGRLVTKRLVPADPSISSRQPSANVSNSPVR